MGRERATWITPELLDRMQTPALVYDERELKILLDLALGARQVAGCRLLYAVKAASISVILQYFAPQIDGFAVSSLFEARLVRDLSPDSKVHLTTPGIRSDEAEELSDLCDFVSFNSLPQAVRYGPVFAGRCSIGIRINTRIASVSDWRYDPCRPASKLGMPIEDLARLDSSLPFSIDGLHIHTNCESTDFGELLCNVEALLGASPDWLRPQWVNLGGGYLFDGVPLSPLVHAVTMVQTRMGAEVFLEPGTALVGGAGTLVATVVDMFDVDGVRIAILDASVNHMPEVLEFQYSPEVVGHDDAGQFEYRLAGSTCLAGDEFGTYRFAQPLFVGSKLIIEDAGAYTLAKAHRFNGVNLPQVGLLGADGDYKICMVFNYSGFASHWVTNV